MTDGALGDFKNKIKNPASAVTLRGYGRIKKGFDMLDYTRNTRRKGNPYGDQSISYSEEQTLCSIPHCNRRRADTVSIHLCEYHIEKAWAAHHVLNGINIPEREEIERDLYSLHAKGTVYVIRVGDLIKIGWTSNPRERMHQLKPDAVLHYQQGTRQDEIDLHARCEKYLAKGKEWFRDSPGMKRIIEELQLNKDGKHAA